MINQLAKSLRRFVNSFSDEERKGFLDVPVRRRSTQLRHKVTLTFENITPSFLATYEQWMQHYGKASQIPLRPSTAASLTTGRIYLRHVHAVIDDAIEAGIISRDTYPFGRNRYITPAGANVKKALPRADIEKTRPLVA